MNTKLFEALEWIAHILEEDRIPYHITGGLAAHFYGAYRPINDIDIDISEDKFDVIYDKIKKFIIFGPEHYKDECWDVKLVTLDYQGQNIDIGGAHQMYIFDCKKNKWIHIPTDFSKARIFTINEIKFPVHDPYDLMAYKKLLVGDHQIHDIKAIEKYCRLHQGNSNEKKQ